MWDYQSRKSPVRQLTAGQVNTMRKMSVSIFMTAFRFFFSSYSQIHYLGASHIYMPYWSPSYSLRSGTFCVKLKWTYGNEMCLNIYYTRKWRGKNLFKQRLEPLLTIFTSLPPLFSFYSSRKRPTYIMISGWVSTDLLQGQKALWMNWNVFTSVRKRGEVHFLPWCHLDLS